MDHWGPQATITAKTEIKRMPYGILTKSYEAHGLLRAAVGTLVYIMLTGVLNFALAGHAGSGLYGTN